MINANKSPFEGGANRLQGRRARAIHGYLHMMAMNGRKQIDALERAAKAQGFVAKWGGRLVHAWGQNWLNR